MGISTISCGSDCAVELVDGEAEEVEVVFGRVIFGEAEEAEDEGGGIFVR